MPDTFPTPRVWVAGERVTASKMNEISTALGVLYPFTAGGQIPYRDPAGNYISAIDPPASVDGYLKMLTTGEPVYTPENLMPGVLHAYDNNYSDTIPDTASGTYVSTTVEKNLVISCPCTIVAIAIASANKTGATYHAGFLVEIDGTQGRAPAYFNGNTRETIMAMSVKRNVSAGTRACKLMYAISNPSETLSVVRAEIHAFAFVEP